MKKRNLILLIVAVLIVIRMTAYVVNETNQAVVLELGKPVRTVIEPGLHFKIPWPIQTVAVFEKRILNYDSAPTEILTMDKKNLTLDNFAKWRIIDPLKFLVTVHDENGAQARLDDII